MGGPQYGPQNSRALIRRTTQNRPLILGNPLNNPLGSYTGARLRPASDMTAGLGSAVQKRGSKYGPLGNPERSPRKGC